MRSFCSNIKVRTKIILKENALMKNITTIFDIIISKCNRKMRRILNLPKQLVAIDSTTVTVGENRLKWAKFKGKKSGIKLHVALNISDFAPQKIVETIAKKHDGPIGEDLVDINSILVEDRAYGKHQRFDMFKESHSLFHLNSSNSSLVSISISSTS